MSSTSADVLIGRIGDRVKQCDGAHDLAGLAVAALRDLLLQPRLLHRMQLAALRNPFDRPDVATYLADRRRT